MRSGTIYSYRIEPAASVRLAIRIDRPSATILTSSQPFYRGASPSAADFGAPGDRYKEIFGMLPVEVGTIDSALYRRLRYDAAVGQVWTGMPRKIVQGRFEEYSNVAGKPRKIGGLFRTMLLGCADLPVAGRTEAAKVFRVVMPARTVNMHASPPVDTIRVNDFRYYMSLARGIMLRQETPSGSIQVDKVVVPR